MPIPDGYNVQPIGPVIGTADADNEFDSSLVTPNENGSVLERLEDVREKMGRCVSLGQAAAGVVKIERLGALVTTVLPAGANTLKFSFTPTGKAATDLCAATDTASAAAQQLSLVDGVKATVLTKCSDVGVGVLAANANMPLILGPGVIQTIYSAGAPATGAVTLFVEYEPLVPGAVIT